MRFELVCLLFVVCAVYAQAPAASSADKVGDGRFFFTTLTWVFSTSTTTLTSTSTATCTTSTATLTTCTAGRRRRGLFFDEGENRNGRGLFYDEQEEALSEVFSNIQKRAAPKKSEETKSSAPAVKTGSELIPLNIQSGISVPSELGSGRFGLALGTTTTTITTISTTTATLTAVCASTTNYPTCGSGK